MSTATDSTVIRLTGEALDLARRLTHRTVVEEVDCFAYDNNDLASMINLRDLGRLVRSLGIGPIEWPTDGSLDAVAVTSLRKVCEDFIASVEAGSTFDSIIERGLQARVLLEHLGGGAMSTTTDVYLGDDAVLLAREVVREEIMNVMAMISSDYATPDSLQELLDYVRLITVLGPVENSVHDRHRRPPEWAVDCLVAAAQAQVISGDDAAEKNWDEETPRYEELVASARGRAENGRRLLAVLQAEHAEQ